jgi:hypothetical protein
MTTVLDTSLIGPHGAPRRGGSQDQGTLNPPVANVSCGPRGLIRPRYPFARIYSRSGRLRQCDRFDEPFEFGRELALLDLALIENQSSYWGPSTQLGYIADDFACA